jgi:hypothetical protein
MLNFTRLLQMKVVCCVMGKALETYPNSVEILNLFMNVYCCQLLLCLQNLIEMSKMPASILVLQF